MADKLWYHLENDQVQIGPESAAALRRLLLVGKIWRDTLVWTEGMPDWTPLAETEIAQGLEAAVSRLPTPSADERLSYRAAAPAGHASHSGAAEPMSFLSAVISVYARTFRFSGRASRSEYWYFELFASGLPLVLLSLAIMNNTDLKVFLDYTYAAGAMMLVSVLPRLSATVRRLHDTGRSGAWFFVSFVPVIGPIVLLVLLCLAPDPRQNIYNR